VQVRDSIGNPVGERSVAWHSRDTAVARVDTAGVVNGLNLGTVVIVATSDSRYDSAVVQIVEPTLVGAGDIASCHSDGDEATAAILDTIPGTVFAAGDLVYMVGTASNFATCYDPSWGRHKDRTRPAPGNHEYYDLPNAAGYYGYFGAQAGDPNRGYYSYDLGSWHIVVLNSNIGSGAGSSQEQWLRADLAAHPAVCTLAYWHHPLFTSGAERPNPGMRPIWQALYDAGADVVINGHDHDYERFAPQAPNGTADGKRGIRQFIVGTGGYSHIRLLAAVASNSELRDDTSFGVLKLVLHDTSYDWQFIPAAGNAFSDSGTGYCH
jgi:hypothetical protein